jgi:hypothetical protein
LGGNIGLHSVAVRAAQHQPPVRFRTGPCPPARRAAKMAAVPDNASILLLDDDPDVGLAAQLLL